MSVSGAFWVLGGLSEGPSRAGCWLAAVAIEYASPLANFWVPGLGRSSTTDWDVDGHHLAERCALFVIIALGESILVTGATFAGQAWTAPTIVSLRRSPSSAAWRCGGSISTPAPSAPVNASPTPTTLAAMARSAYTYLHLPIIGGVIVCAVADELVLAHPDHASDAGLAAILGGPALYLVGNALFKWVSQRPPRGRRCRTAPGWRC